MPKVGNKEFSYTKKGMAAAKKAAKDTDQEVKALIEFCNGLEYELDSFIDYVISELKNSDN